MLRGIFGFAAVARAALVQAPKSSFVYNRPQLLLPLGSSLTLQQRGAKTKTQPVAQTETKPKPRAKATSPVTEKKNETAKKVTKAASPAVKKTAEPKADEHVSGAVRKLSPYAAFVKKMYDDAKKAGSVVSFVDLSKKAASTWKTLSDAEKKAYEGVMTTAKMKRARSAYDLFRAKRLPELMSNPNRMSVVVKEWKEMAAVEKSKYAAEVMPASPKGAAVRDTPKKSSWQVFVTDFMAKLSDAEKKGRDQFRDNIKKAAAEFKKLSDQEKQKLAERL